MYLSLGDSIGQRCCPAFADYLARKLNRNVQTVNLAGDESSSDLITGVNHVRPSQLDIAVTAIQEYAAGGHPVVAVTLVTGLKDFELQVASCGEATNACREAMKSQFLTPFSERLGLIFSRLSSAATQAPPILVLNYDRSGCDAADSKPFTIDDVNRTIAEAVSNSGGRLVDVALAPEGCDSRTGATPAPAWVDFIERELETTYEALPTP